MKVLLLNQFFHPEVAAVAQIATDLAEDLVASGIEVGWAVSNASSEIASRIPLVIVCQGAAWGPRADPSSPLTPRLPRL